MAEPTPSALEKGPKEEEHTQDDEKQQHPDIVDFEGPDDPENAMNWPTRKKMRQLVLIAFNTFIT